MNEAPSLPAVAMENIDFSFGNLQVLSHVELNVQRSEVVAIVGPSGCGKSTLLRVIAGLERPQTGNIVVAGDKGDRGDRSLRFLFQDYDAFPWLTVFENVQIGSGVAPHPIASEVAALLERVGLLDYSGKYPFELSGGMRKRLALARALIRNPRLLLLDEPFASLDVNTRFEMYELVQELASIAGTAILLVTHDLNEAIFLADRVLVGTPRPLSFHSEVPVKLDRPRTAEMMDESEFLRALRQLHREFSRPDTKSESLFNTPP